MQMLSTAEIQSLTSQTFKSTRVFNIQQYLISNIFQRETYIPLKALILKFLFSIFFYSVHVLPYSTVQFIKGQNMNNRR